MDPNAALINLRDSLKAADLLMLHSPDVTVAKLEDSLWAIMEHFGALDAWLSKGGFLPEDWQH